ncbi:MAG: ATP-binding protein, partial [Nocardioidaceae bacterium]
FRRRRREALAAAAEGDRDVLIGCGTEALRAYRGELMPGSREDWVVRERELVRTECVQLCDVTGAALADAGDLAVAVEVARARVRLEPLEEQGYRTLIERQIEAGDRAAAVSTFHRCVSVLEEQLGIGPAVETVALVDAAIGRPADAGRVRRRRRTVADLVGREQELGRLTELWGDAVAGGSRLVAVGGDPGVGKSRLVAELCVLAREQGAAVAVSRCFGQSGRLALAPVADWLRSHDVRAGLPGLDAHWRTEIARLVPRVSDEAPEGAAGGTAGTRAMVDRWQRHRFFEALAVAVLHVKRPTLLVLDDLQWCDEETLTWIGFLLRYAREAPLLVATTYRPGGPESDVAKAIRTLRSAGQVDDIALGPLEPAGTAALVERLRPDRSAPVDTALMHAVTGGFPLFVVEACRSASSAALGTADLDVVLRRRLEEVSAEAKEIAQLAAAVGRDFTLDLLTEAGDLDADSVVTAVDELWRRRIVRERGYGYDFSHDMLREAAYQMVSPARRWLLHRRLAQGLELLHEGRLTEVAAQIARQYDRGGRPDRAVRFYRQAGDAACAVFANAEGIRHYQRCLELIAAQPPGRSRDDHELAVLEAMSAPVTATHGYSSVLLERTQQRSVELCEQLDRPRELLSSQIGLWAVRFVQGRTVVAHELAERALTLARSQPSLAGQTHLAFAGSATSLGLLDEAVEHFELARTRSRDEVSLAVGTRPEVHAMCWSAHAHWLLGHDELALRRRDEAVDRARQVGHPYTLVVALAYAGVTDQMFGEVERVRRTTAELTELCERYGFAYYSEWGRILTAWAGGGTASTIETSIRTLRAKRSHARTAYWLSLLADVHHRSGRTDAERAALDAATVAAHTYDDVWWLPEVMRRRAALGPAEDAVAGIERALALSVTHSSHALADRCRADLARYATQPPVGRSAAAPDVDATTNDAANARTNAGRTPRA